MYILKDGRPAFLEFLRNLTPQVLMLSLAFVLGAKLNFSRFDFSNWLQTFAFFVFLLLAGLSVAANTTLFIDRFAPLDRVNRALTRASRLPAKRNRAKMRHTWRNKGVISELAFIMLAVQFGLVAVFVTSVRAALQMAG